MAETGAAGSQPNTPTSKKGGGRQRRAAGTQNRRVKGKKAEEDTGTEDIDGDGEDVEDAGNDSLFDLLGITSPPVVDGNDGATADKGGKGILAISRADIERSGNENTPKKENKGRAQRNQRNGPETESEPRQQGGGGRRAKSGDQVNGQQERDAISEGESKRKRQPRKPRAKAEDPSALSASTSSPIVTTPVSTLSATRPKGGAQRQGRSKAIAEPVKNDSSDDAFETASLSQSLPSERLFGPSRSGPLEQVGAANGKGKGKGKKGNATAEGNDNLVWEMPEVPGPSANQALTWQQKLQSSTSTSESPRRSNRSTPLSNPSASSHHSPGHSHLPDRKSRSRPNTSVNSPHPPSAMPSSPLVARPTHARRLSLDNNVPVSAFDHTQPFHTGFNVHRAPQTPAKLPGNMAPAHHLPILHQEFPRIAKGTGHSPYVSTPPAAPGVIPMGPITTPAHAKIKYAGPTFHNSPHGASLPKPDLDDF